MKNKIFILCSWLSFISFFIIFFAVAGNIILTGLDGFSLSFIIDSFKNSGREGGIATIIVSTLIITFFALLISLIISLLSAICIDHFSANRRITKTLKLSLDTLSATPSIVFGLIGNIIFCEFLGLGYSLISGSLTLALMILPIQTRIILIGLSSITKDISLGAHALNLKPFTSYFRIKIHLIKNQILSGTFIGLGRALAETAALLFTSGYGVKMPTSLLDSGRTLSIHIYDLAMNIPGGNANAYKSAFTLILLVFFISLITTAIQKRFKLGRQNFIKQKTLPVVKTPALFLCAI